MKTIYKYKLNVGPNKIDLPVGAQILTAQMQPGLGIMLWAVVQPGSVILGQERYFNVYGTGFILPEVYGKYISTVQDRGLVWHVFEVENET